MTIINTTMWCQDGEKMVKWIGRKIRNRSPDSIFI